MKAYIGDIESTIYNGKDLETKAWLLCLSEYDTEYNHYFTNINDYMKFIIEHDETNFFFHNLAGFDSNFLIDWLVANDYSFIRKGGKPRNPEKFVVGNSQTNFTVWTISQEEGLKVQNFFDTKKYLKESVAEIGESLGLPKGETPLIRHPKKVMIELFGKVPKKYKLVCGVLNGIMPLSKSGKQYNIKVVKEYTPQKNDYEYITRDCKIIKEGMRKYGFMEAYENRIYSISNYALQCALNEVEKLDLKRIEEFEPVNKPKGFVRRYNERRFKKYRQPTVKTTAPKRFVFKTKTGITHYKEIKHFIKQVKRELSLVATNPEKKKLERELAQLDKYLEMHGNFILNREQNLYGRLSFKGGFIYCNPTYKDKWIKQLGITLDNNSIHPYHLRNMKLPDEYVAKAKNLKEFNRKYDSDRYVYIAVINRVKAKVKRGCLPTIKLREDEIKNTKSSYDGIWGASVESEIDYKTALTQPDFEYLLENYKIEKLDYWLMVMTVNDDFSSKMGKYIDYWSSKKIEAKEAGDLFLYQESKAMMNSFIGFLGVNKDTFESSKKGKNELKNEGTSSDLAKSYICISSFINAYSRTKTARTANKIGLKNFCYSAVDSIHMILPENCKSHGKYDELKTIAYFKNLDIKIDDYELGAWKIEKVWDRAKFIGANCYGENSIQSGWGTTISGYKRQVPMKDFKIGYKGTHLMAEKVKGGTLLLPTTYTVLGF